ncbi:MAG: Glutathione hydrolase proenzyme [Candidatus Moanabacter tarae]|mgnify:CR=1 FL=1|uniref:Glutathione hydrolase proenzyme n=1 Tax=Candidatus Moanibacter tarae TaxID=2200854 RepID=A0A2Z4AER2_9BACT|nr:MAG: Glutathione hydrolase proenzyme [Candidatus Moanabacter tarae]|tara:strand:- start:8186 stop:9802 length:1617 start_codon:yes stop_codon:yes gene_type:complete
MEVTKIQSIGWNAKGKEGAVAAGAAEAVAAGIEILEGGGNAADAAAGVILALNVTDHGLCSIGGEVPVLIFDVKKREVKSLSGQGSAPLSRDAIDWYMKNGIPYGDIKMAPVPSVVDLCVTLLQRYGTRSFEDIVSPTLALLDSGSEVWHPNLAVTLRRMVEEENLARGSREERLQAATDRFYGRNPERNDIAEDLEAFYTEQGGFLSREDLAAHRTLIEEPVSINYKGFTVYKCGSWTQGPYLCQALRLLEGFDLKQMGYLSADYVHVVIEAIKLAMADRDEYYGDPNFVDVPIRELLSDDYTKIRRTLIDMKEASHEARPGDPYRIKALKGPGQFRPGEGGTTTCVVADRWGNVVSATPSANVYHDGGTGRAGISYGNRLRSLNTTTGHPNCIAPGKRPRITLTPTLVLKDESPVLAISVAGGDLQDQATLNLLLDFIEFGMEPAEAVREPRFATDHHEDSFDPNPDRGRTFIRSGSLAVSERVAKEVRNDLALRGHEIEARIGPIATPVMLYSNSSDGFYSVAGDPEAGRHAAAI